MHTQPGNPRPSAKHLRDSVVDASVSGSEPETPAALENDARVKLATRRLQVVPTGRLAKVV
jgi:hypothetical protein